MFVQAGTQQRQAGRDLRQAGCRNCICRQVPGRQAPRQVAESPVPTQASMVRAPSIYAAGRPTYGTQSIESRELQVPIPDPESRVSQEAPPGTQPRNECRNRQENSQSRPSQVAGRQAGCCHARNAE